MDYLFSWLKNILHSLGLWNIQGKMVLIGLDNAGKTTLLGVLSKGRVMSCPPTLQPHYEELALGGINFKTFDLGGHPAGREIWKDYLIDVDAIVFLVDAVDKERFPDVKKTLDKVLSMDNIKNVPFLILGNKIDQRGAASEEELREALALYDTTSKTHSLQLGEHVRPLELFMCSIVHKQGYAEGFRWLSSYISK